MTQEELIKKIDAEIAKLSDNASQMCEEYEGYRLACQDISDVLHEIAKEIQPSLSSNLDEAAEDSWAIYEYRESPRGLYSTCYVDGFKSGAEWMAGQGITVGGTFHHSCGYPSVIILNTYLMDCEGEEVIVQIRKK